MKPILNECPDNESVKKCWERRILFIYIHNVECHNADVVFTVFTVYLDLFTFYIFCFPVDIKCRGVEQSDWWLVGNSMYKISVKIPVWQPGTIYELVKTKWPPGRRCRTTPGPPLCFVSWSISPPHHTALHCSLAREMLSKYNLLFIYFTKADQSNSAFSSCLNIQIKRSQWWIGGWEDYFVNQY